MLEIRLAVEQTVPDTLALPVGKGARTGESGPGGELLPTAYAADRAVREEALAFISDVEHTGGAGVVHTLARPLASPRRVLLTGVGAGDEAGWRAAGAAIARSARQQPSVTVGLPAAVDPAAVRGLAEGLWLAAYRFRVATEPPDKAPKLASVTIVVDETGRYEPALAVARAVAEATMLARDLTNTPSDRKSPAWLAERIREAAASHPGLSVVVREPEQLTAEGFNAILAVGNGSVRPPRLVELSWQPPQARTHVVLVGKGITFDTGGICIKPRDGMRLMRKDMGGAAAVAAATIAAAALNLPVRVTALAPLAENMASGTAYRPGDVVRHYGGMTTEVLNTDAEGRLVLADAMAYAARHLDADLLVDLATLTGAQSVALGKRTAALYSDSDPLAEALAEAATAAGERVWRMPMPDDYRDALDSDVADLVNSTQVGAGSVMAAMYLREFAGTLRDRWAHLDMSAPAWADSPDRELVKGATGWGVRTLVRWLDRVAGEAPSGVPVEAAAS
ncbi:leucyl aminopeptidase [Planosporangium mesophilum]|uniref:Probable cytosol aminopeptidase n=1 Tax=Planosporangium mesophilum TaxID=689768 RepID=A0A8J3T9V1_9ACTN|nr:leucyl aminopeptidase [Planosporangium mesophilum]NJC81046.1 leucyl aminopeptidase [Planosporangium mesophilum]GII21311.1 leucyl aminopeptidase [Planosporangium mesophilum]